MASIATSKETKTNHNTITDLVFDTTKVLGLGGSGATVYEGTASIEELGLTDHPVAIKVFPPEAFGGRVKVKNDAIAEYNKLRDATKCGPDNFCTVYGCVDDDERGVLIVMKKYKGTLLDEMEKRPANKPRLPLKRTVDVSIKVAQSLSLLHPKILYLDLKPQNIFVDSEKNTVVGDFGISRTLQTDKSHLSRSKGTSRGTPCYMSPAQCGADDFDADADDSDAAAVITVKSDVWTFGTTLLHLLSGVAPWSAELEKDTRRDEEWIRGRLGKRKAPKRNLPESTPDFLKQLVDRCLAPNPAERPNFIRICRELEEFKATYPFDEEEEEEEEEENDGKEKRNEDSQNDESKNEESKKSRSKKSNLKTDSSSSYKERIKQLEKQVQELKAGQQPKTALNGGYSDDIDSETQIDLGEINVKILKIQEREMTAQSPIIRTSLLNGLRSQITKKEEELQKSLVQFQKKVDEKQQEYIKAGLNEEFDKAATLGAEVEDCQQEKTKWETVQRKEISELEEHWKKKDTLLRQGFHLKQYCVEKTEEIEREIAALKKEQPKGWVDTVKGKRAATKEYEKLIVCLNKLEVVGHVEKMSHVSLLFSLFYIFVHFFVVVE